MKFRLHGLACAIGCTVFDMLVHPAPSRSPALCTLALALSLALSHVLTQSLARRTSSLVPLSGCGAQAAAAGQRAKRGMMT